MTSFKGQKNLNRDAVFWSKVDIGDVDECWNYKEGKSREYGYFWIGGGHTSAHRFAYESYYKCKIPEGKLVLHKCDNPLCCNPKHLYLGTYADNMKDKMTKGRCKSNPRKTAITLTKFSAKDVRDIRKLKIVMATNPTKYKYSLKYVAKKFKVVPSTIFKIWNSRYLCRDGYYI